MAAVARATLALLLLFCIAAHCVSAEFRLVPQTSQRHALRLARADRLGIPYEGLAHNCSTSPAAFALSLDADFFDSLSAAQFAALGAAYSSWSATKSRVTYSSGERYTLLDFLPPLMQTTSGLRFAAQHHNYSLPSFDARNPQRQISQSCPFLDNCWGFAYEAMYAAATPTDVLTFSLASPVVAFATFFDDASFDLMQSSMNDPLLLSNSSVRNQKLQPGDLILIWHKNPGDRPYLDHAAVFIDDDVYYERAGTGDSVPFRLIDWSGLIGDWPLVAFNFDWRRRRADHTPVAALEAFALNNPVSLEETRYVCSSTSFTL